MRIISVEEQVLKLLTSMQTELWVLNSNTWTHLAVRKNIDSK